jgi:hypothetical protein
VPPRSTAMRVAAPQGGAFALGRPGDEFCLSTIHLHTIRAD